MCSFLMEPICITVGIDCFVSVRSQFVVKCGFLGIVKCIDMFGISRV